MDGVQYAILGVNLENFDVNCKNYNINQDILAHAESEAARQVELIESIKKLIKVNAEILQILTEDKRNA